MSKEDMNVASKITSNVVSNVASLRNSSSELISNQTLRIGTWVDDESSDLIGRAVNSADLA